MLTTHLQAGEILLRGPNVFNGYWKKPELDKDTFTDGWYRTGDVGYVNATGHFYITDRIKELIKYSMSPSHFLSVAQMLTVYLL